MTELKHDPITHAFQRLRVLVDKPGGIMCQRAGLVGMLDQLDGAIAHPERHRRPASLPALSFTRSAVAALHAATTEVEPDRALALVARGRDYLDAAVQCLGASAPINGAEDVR